MGKIVRPVHPLKYVYVLFLPMSQRLKASNGDWTVRSL